MRDSPKNYAGETVGTTGKQPGSRNQVDQLETEIYKLKAVIEEQRNELLGLYRRINQSDGPEREY